MACLAACGKGSVDKTYTIATLFPASGSDAAVGLALQNAVDLAVKQHVSLGKGYTLTVKHIDSSTGDAADALSKLAADSHLIGLVGPLDSQTAADVLPVVERDGIPTISPGATLPGLTESAQATVEGLSFTQLHPTGKALAFFRIPENDTAMGKAAAKLVVTPSSSHGLAAREAFVIDDGSVSGKTLASAFTAALKADGGSVVGHQSIVTGKQDNAQSVVTAIIEAYPDIVFYAGGVAGGADLRETLSLTGAPNLTILTAGAIADDPMWSEAVGVTPAAASTVAILPAQDPSKLADAKSFVSAYQSAYPDAHIAPQSLLAYDAAMDEITAAKGIVATGKPPTRATVLAAVAAAKYVGMTGTLAFDLNGDDTTSVGFSVYDCDVKGAWHLQSSLPA